MFMMPAAFCIYSPILGPSYSFCSSTSCLTESELIEIPVNHGVSLVSWYCLWWRSQDAICMWCFENHSYVTQCSWNWNQWMLIIMGKSECMKYGATSDVADWGPSTSYNSAAFRNAQRIMEASVASPVSASKSWVQSFSNGRHLIEWRYRLGCR